MYVFIQPKVLKRQHCKCLIFTALKMPTFIAAKLNWFTVCDSEDILYFKYFMKIILQ